MKTRVNEFFDSVTPVRSDDEIIADVLRKAENMKNNTKRFSIKKPVIAACAAVCILGAGVTAAAATGLIDFEAIFSRHIAAENDLVAGKILANVSSVVTQVSDENYNAELKAVISDSGTIIGCIELSRKDGTPIADSFVNPLPDLTQGNRSLFSWKWNAISLGTGYQYLDGIESSTTEYVFNENGNLDIYFDLIKDHYAEQGKVALQFTNIHCMDYDTNTYTLLLPINVRVQFGYETSAEALVSRTIANPEQPFELDTASDTAIKAYVAESKLNCAGATFRLASVEPEAPYSLSIGNETFGLIKDGKTVGIIQPYLHNYNGISFLNSSVTTSATVLTDAIIEINFTCMYRDLNGNIAAFDISEIDAVEINGTIYPLK